MRIASEQKQSTTRSRLGNGVSKGIRAQRTIELNSLDLTHRWAALSDTAHTTAHVDTGASTLHGRENKGDSEGNEAEPEESGGGLSLVAALAGVWGSVGDKIGGCVGL